MKSAHGPYGSPSDPPETPVKLPLLVGFEEARRCVVEGFHVVLHVVERVLRLAVDLILVVILLAFFVSPLWAVPLAVQVFGTTLLGAVMILACWAIWLGAWMLASLDD